MTEAQWLAGTDPEAMVRFIRFRTTSRKSRLLACACYRRFGHYWNAEITKAIEAAEAHDAILANG